MTMVCLVFLLGLFLGFLVGLALDEAVDSLRSTRKGDR